MPLCRDSVMYFFHFYFFVKMCGARAWPHMLFCTLLIDVSEDGSVLNVANFGKNA